MPDDFARLVVNDPHMVWAFGWPVVRPTEMSCEDIFGSLQPFKTDKRDDCQVRVPIGSDFLGHRDPRHTTRYTRTASRRFEGLWK
jgi:hypothetical protein